MKFIHSGDFHLGMTLASASFADSENYHKRRLELLEVYERIVTSALEENVDFLLLCGDLFDDVSVKPTFVEAVFQRLAELPFHTYIVIGNHDRFLHNRAYDFIRTLDNVHFFSDDQRTYTLKDIAIHGFNTHDFTEDKLQKLSLDKEKKHILCLHGDVNNPRDDHYLMAYKSLAKHPFDYIALGHIHKHQFLDKHIAYCGNPEPFDFSETGDKGYIIGEITDRIAIRFVPFALRNFHILPMVCTPKDTLSSLKEKIMKIPEDIRQKDFLRFELTGAVSSHIELNDTTLSTLKDGAFYIEFINKTRIDFDLERLKERYQDTLIADIIKRYQEDENDHDLKSLTLALELLLEGKEGAL